ncbi:hypothetical protein L873DRAFT_324658 [Choiromyces venosus 120613-1]|uniref:Uncharacterized protein n=1 Tax=Choiromyces venosus 120613-1 TaxID=1336337 RepID=A0A3N4K0N6_9PEZI|nr:hypothetical protein L873DRAFT_324658 [Choiromyces venosus 120613-1]
MISIIWSVLYFLRISINATIKYSILIKQVIFHYTTFHHLFSFFFPLPRPAVSFPCSYLPSPLLLLGAPHQNPSQKHHPSLSRLQKKKKERKRQRYHLCLSPFPLYLESNREPSSAG